jgi:hypothetical protein
MIRIIFVKEAPIYSVTPAKAGVQCLKVAGFRLSPE